MFSGKFSKFSKNTFLTEQLQCLLLRFNSCFQRSPEQKLAEAVVRRCSVKEVFLEISQNSHESTNARVSSLIKFQASGLQLYQRRDSGILSFPVNFVKFLGTPFLNRRNTFP